MDQQFRALGGEGIEAMIMEDICCDVSHEQIAPKSWNGG